MTTTDIGQPPSEAKKNRRSPHPSETTKRKMTMMDGNQAVTHVAHKVNEIIAI